MTPTQLTALAVLSACLVAGCAARVPYRDAGFSEIQGCDPQFYSEYSHGKRVATAPADARAACWNRSIEEHANYDLMFVEFDDQGWLQKTSDLKRPGRDYLDDFFERIEALRRAHGTGLNLVVFVHGWHHNAGANDANVRSFRRYLGDIAIAESQAQGAAARRVVGIYVGWRGESITVPVLNMLTFWERKNTAERIAQGSVREFFSRLDMFRDRVDRIAAARGSAARTKGQQAVRLAVIGHSFGGLIVYQSLSSEFLRASARYDGELAPGQCQRKFLTRFGDLVILVNPAFEGVRYEPLKVAGERLKCLDADQLPLVITVTSTADRATKNAFPIARYFNTLWEDSPGHQQTANVYTVGHNDRYRTHALAKCDKDDAACHAACPAAVLEPVSKKVYQLAEQSSSVGERNAQISTELAYAKSPQGRGKSGDAGKRTDYFCGGLKLTDTESWFPPSNPFWVVQTTKDIIRDHNDIFNERFAAFMRQMYLRIAVATDLE